MKEDVMQDHRTFWLEPFGLSSISLLLLWLSIPRLLFFLILHWSKAFQDGRTRIGLTAHMDGNLADCLGRKGELMDVYSKPVGLKRL